MFSTLVMAMAVMFSGGIQDTPAADKSWPPAGVVRMGKGTGVTAPEVVKEMHPKYTAAAKAAKIQGSVNLEAIVLADGSIGEVRVTKSLDREHGLDEEAIKAVKRWRFKPGKKDGAAVPVLVEIELTFKVL